MATTRQGLRPYLLSLALLIGIFAIALFIRSYFAYDMATRDGFLVSGGSDSYQHKRVIDYADQTGDYLWFDPTINYPVGMVNPRPPIYTWSTVLTGYLIAPLMGGDSEAAIWWSLMFGTSIWGALTVFPTYFLAKEAFGKRTGYVAALLLAITPGHIVRSPFSDADHDAMALFFVVLSFYFFLKALRSLKERSYVSRWRSAILDPRAFLWEVRSLFVENRRPVLYALMAAFSLETVALIWQGWPYALVIMIGYLFVQLLVHRFRNQDPLGIVAIFAVVGAVTLVLAVPYYSIWPSLFRGFYFPPLGMYLGGLAMGLAFAATRRYPWVIAVPAILAAAMAAVFLVGTLLFPSVPDAVLSGFGYFPRNKIYETIAEAQAPSVSLAILSFGAVTYYLSLAGLGWMLYQFPKRPVPDYIFVVIWAGASIFMAMTQARFLFNASVAFAVSAAWATSLLIDRLKFEDIAKAMRSVQGRPRFGALRRGLRFRHVGGALFVAFLLILPNTWLAVDAATPFEKKEELDKQVVQSLPDWLRPAGYQEGQLFYFGAFGYSLPLPNRYFPKAWEWFSQQDTHIPAIVERPAYLSWWDYGFEAVQAGRHPTVADNFQNGIETAGNFIAAQSENQAIAILTLRLLDGDFAVVKRARGFSPDVVDVLQRWELDPDEFLDVYLHPSSYIAVVLADPSRFGPYDSRMSEKNAKIIYLSTVMREKLDLHEQAGLYEDIMEVTGYSIRYFSIDSRLIPFSAQNTGIFYAPIKLSDHRIIERPDGRVIPADFFRIRAQLPGGQWVDITETSLLTRVQNVDIQYQEMFYNSMLYRTFFGISPGEAGQDVNGLPGLPGDAQGIQPLPGWMLSHFRVVYRTAYFNPFPPEEVANHTNAWTAINHEDAVAMQERIARGEANGTVDLSTGSGLSNGIVFLKYYHGAVAEGRVTTSEGVPIAGARVTVQDEFDIPHHVNITDSNGRYRAVLPFGSVKLKVSTGTVDNTTQVGNSLLAEATLNVSDDQAMRRVADYTFNQDFVVSGQALSGRAFIDLNQNGRLDAGERILANVPITFRGGLNVQVDIATNSLGAYSVKGLLPGSYSTTVKAEGRDLAGPPVVVRPGSPSVVDLNVTGTTFSGTITYGDGTPASGAILSLLDLGNGTRIEARATDGGTFSVGNLLVGDFRIFARDPSGASRSLERGLRLPMGGLSLDFVISPFSNVSGQVTIGGAAAPNIPVSFQRRGGPDSPLVTATSDPQGRYRLTLTQGTYDVYALAFRQGRPHAFLGSIVVRGGADLTYAPGLVPAVTVSGRTSGPEPNVTVPDAVIAFEGAQGRIASRSSSAGQYSLVLPPDQYMITARKDNGIFLGNHLVSSSTTLDLQLLRGSTFSGAVFRDLNGNERYDPPDEGVGDVEVRIQDSKGKAFSAFTEPSGFFDGVGFNGTSYTLTASPPGYFPLHIPEMPLEDFIGRTTLMASPQEVEVSGKVTLEGESLPANAKVTILFQGRARGAVNATVEVDPDGSYFADLLPGEYNLVVEHNLTADGTVRMVNRRGEGLVLRVGQEEVTRDLDLVRKHRIDVNVTAGGSGVPATVTFRGPEDATSPPGHNGTFSLHLLPGSYDVYSHLQVEGVDYAFLDLVTVSVSSNLPLPLAPAPRVTGGVRVGTNDVLPSLTMNFTRMVEGAERGRIEVDSNNGNYFAVLPPGTYRITTDFPTSDTFDGAQRYVRYHGPTTIEVAPEEPSQAIGVQLLRRFDNSTLRGLVLAEGSPVDATMTFRANNPSAISTVANTVAGSYSVGLQPGRYDVYVRGLGSQASMVFLSSITVEPRAILAFDLHLVRGSQVRGTVISAQGFGIPANLTITGDATFTASTAGDGTYAVVVPPGTYAVRADTELMERGTRVPYTGEGRATVTEGTVVLDLELSRISRRSVAVLWDSSQRTTVVPGQSVSYTITVQNRGSVADTYSLSGLPQDWTFTFDRPRVEIDFVAGANQTTVTVTITSPANALVEHPAVRVIATSEIDSTISTSAVVDVGIHHRRGVAVSPSTRPAVLDATVLDIPVTLRNAGNGADRYTVKVLNGAELASLGWEVFLISPRDGSTLPSLAGVEVSANTSQDFVVRLQGPGRSGIVLVAAHPEGRPEMEQVAQLPIDFPEVSLGSGGVAITGPGVATTEAFPWTYLILLSFVGAAFGLFLFMRYRRRSRTRRRRR